MNSFEEIIKRRGITHLCHFTKSISLPFIFGKQDDNVIPNGIISRELLEQSDLYSSLPKGTGFTDFKRLDRKKDRISVSIQCPNEFYFKKAKEKEDNKIPFRDWCILLINPNIIGEDTIFSPINAASKSISDKMNINENYFKGPKAFEYLFSQEIKESKHSRYRRKEYPDNITTDLQAELLIKDKISYKDIIGIVFENERQAILEQERLLFCDTFNLNFLNFYVCPEMFSSNFNLKPIMFNFKFRRI